jgi:hypothetical protein
MENQSTNLSGVGAELLKDGKSVGSSVANRLHSEVDARKSDGLAQVQAVSSALEKTAGSLDEGAPTWLKNAVEQGARQISRFAESLEQKDSRQIVNDVTDFARQSPGTFLAACAAAGFAASRLFKAGAGEAIEGTDTEQSLQFAPANDFANEPQGSISL